MLLNRWIFPYILLVSLAALCQAILNAHHRFAAPGGRADLPERRDHPRGALRLAAAGGADVRARGRRPRRRRPADRHPGAAAAPAERGRPAGARLAGPGGALGAAPDVAAPARLRHQQRQHRRLDAVRRRASATRASRTSTTRTGLKELVLGGFAVSVATAILPLLSRQALAADRGPFKDNLAFALRLIAFVTIPASVGLVVLQTPIVRVLFQGGRFGAADTLATAGRARDAVRSGSSSSPGSASSSRPSTRSRTRRCRSWRRSPTPPSSSRSARSGRGRSAFPASAWPPRPPPPSTSRSCSRRCGGARARCAAGRSRLAGRIVAASAVMGVLLALLGGSSRRSPTSAGGARGC